MLLFIARDLSEVKGIDSTFRYHSHAGEWFVCIGTNHQ